MKKILSILMALVALSSCMSTPEGEARPEEKEGGALVKIRLRTPEGVTATRGLTDEHQNAIENIYALTFGTDGRLREVVEGELSDDQGSFAVTLMSGRVDLTVLANSAFIIESSDIAPGDTYAEVQAALVGRNGDWRGERSGGKPFPMWGEKAGFEIEDGATLDEPIKLTRAFARVDVGVGTYSEATKSWDGKKSDGETIKFEMEAILVMRANDSYALIPNGNGPTIPADAVQYSGDQVCYAIDFDRAIESVAGLFLPELEQGDATPRGERMALIIYGSYDGRTPTYYRVDFVVGGKVVDVLRNHLYRFTIKDVTGDGYANEIDAYNAQPMNIEVDVVAWEDGGESQVGFDGAYYFAIDTRTADLGVLKNSSRTLNIHTNVPDFTLTSGSTTLKAGETKSTTMATYALAGSGENYTLTITTRTDNVKAGGASATDTWAIAAKRIEMGFAAVQAGTTEYITIDGEELTSKNATRVLSPAGGAAGVVEVLSATAMSVTGGQSWLTGATGTVNVPANTLTKLTLSAAAFAHSIESTNTRTAKLTFGSTGKSYTITQHPYALRPVETTIPDMIPAAGGTYRVTAITNYTDWGVKLVNGSLATGTVISTTAAPAASRPATADGEAGVYSMNVTIPAASARTVSLWLYSTSKASAAASWVKVGEWKQGAIQQPHDPSMGILYFAPDNTLSIGVWDNDVVKVSNMAFFKFGSVIGFHNRKTGDPNTGTTAWPTDGSAIHFNPTNLVYGSQITAYAPATYNAATSNALPNIPGYVSADYPKNVTVADGYVTVANLKAGKGDPCMLVGYTGAQLAAMSDSELQGVLDNAAYRLPTDAENKFFAGTNANTTTSAHWTANSTNATDPGIGKFPLVANLLGDAFTYTLPAAGLRNTTNGPVNSQGPYGSYWSATPYSNAGGHRLSFDSGTVYPSGSNDYSRGFSIRCVRRAPEQTDYYFVVVNSSDESMGTVDARLKTGRPGTTFTVTATPKEYNYGVLNWTAEGGATVTKTGPHTAMVTINSNGTVTANFATANVEVGIRDAMGPAWTSRVPAGSQFPVTAKPSEGYVFKNWTTAGGVTVSSTTANPTMVTANSMGSVQANFAQIIDQILYFAPDGKLSLAKWDNNVVKVSNMAFFKFGSVIGFHNRKTGDPNTGTTAWPGVSAILFNPMTPSEAAKITAYAPASYNAATSNALPNIPGYVSGDYPKNVTVADGYVTVANLKAGKGDPCMLVGYTGAQLAAMTDSELQGVLDNAAYRLPTQDENKLFAGVDVNTTTTAHWTAGNSADYAGNPGIGKFPLVANSVGTQYQYTLPAAGYRYTTTGAVNSQGSYGYYWSATPTSDTHGYRLYFGSGYVYVTDSSSYAYGFPVRCVPR